MTVNKSKDIDYHSQRNNLIVPFESCNTTSAIMALKQARIHVPEVEGRQPEDVLSELLRTNEAYDEMKIRAPWAFDFTGPVYPPQQVHTMLEWGVNKYIGEDVDTFGTHWVREDLLAEINLGGGVILSGVFPMNNRGELRHIVSLAGYSRNGEWLWIIDDPYGNWHTGYKDQHGNNVPLSVDEFDTIFLRRSNTYWAHMVRKT